MRKMKYLAIAIALSLSFSLATAVPAMAGPARYSLTISMTHGGWIAQPDDGTFIYDEGTVVDLMAIPDPGYRFVAWTGDVDTIADIYAATTTITMNGDYSIHAAFYKWYFLAVTTTQGGSIAEPGEDIFAYDEGAVVNLVAIPDEGNRFVEWTGDVGSIDDVYAATTTITMNGDYFITANFQKLSIPPPWGIGGCFIATAAYGTPTAKQIDVLREFRDVVLLKSTVGSQFVALYYKFSPPVADFIAGHEVLRTMVRELLVDPVVRVVEAAGDVWRN